MSQTATYFFAQSIISKKTSTTWQRPDAPVHLEIHPLQWLTESETFVHGHQEKLNAYEILWVNSASGVLAVDSKEISMTNRTVYCLIPGQYRSFRSTSGQPEGFYVRLSEELMCRVEIENNSSFLSMQSVNLHHPIALTIDEDMQPAEDILFKMRHEWMNGTYDQRAILKGYFKIFMLYLTRKRIVKETMPVNSKDFELVKQFKILVEKNYREKKKVSQYASELCVTPPYLNRIVKKVSGLTASHHIQQYVVAEAKRMALHSRVSMKEIAYALGFNDNAHFSKFFKNYTGINFSSFKQGTC